MISVSSIALHACPTCLGRLEPESPPFFLDEYSITTEQPEQEEESSTGQSTSQPVHHHARRSFMRRLEAPKGATAGEIKHE
jgi:hypothetical protein